MKTRWLATLLLALPMEAQHLPSYRVNDGWYPKGDKIEHFLVGCAVGIAPSYTARSLGYKHPWLHSLGWALLAGLLKEEFDRRHGGRPDPADIAYTGLGGFSMGLAIRSGEAKKPEFAVAAKLVPTKVEVEDLHSLVEEVP